MKKRNHPGSWFTTIFACGIIAAIGWIALSWFGNLFYVMGPPPGQAAHEAFRTDVRIAPLIIGGSALLGQVATLAAAAATRPTNADSVYWSERHRAELRGRR